MESSWTEKPSKDFASNGSPTPRRNVALIEVPAGGGHERASRVRAVIHETWLRELRKARRRNVLVITALVVAAIVVVSLAAGTIWP